VALNKLVPAEWCRSGVFRHTMEGDDDMPGHVKSSLMGTSLTIPVNIISIAVVLHCSGIELYALTIHNTTLFCRFARDDLRWVPGRAFTSTNIAIRVDGVEDISVIL
jgi:hypothetical protein